MNSGAQAVACMDRYAFMCLRKALSIAGTGKAMEPPCACPARVLRLQILLI